MAFRWRIRHKLTLSLGLVVGVIILLLLGTLYGQASYRATMRSIDSKLAELRAAENFKVVVNALKAPSDNAGLADEKSHFLAAIASAEHVLTEYTERLDETLAHHRDTDKGFLEKQQVQALQDSFKELRRAVADFYRPGPVTGPDPVLLEDARIKKCIADLLQTSGDLRDAIYADMYERSKDGHRYYKTTMWIVISISIGGVVLLCGLLRFFYSWVFHPIHDLQQGAGQVAQGDFEHRIEVHSGDELEDLAAAFNDMTSRLRDMYRDLARQVNERSRQLVRSERLVSVGFLAAGVAHEINNPLASIAFCSEALEQRLAEMLKPTPTPLTRIKDEQEAREVVAKYLKMIQQEAFRCKAITQRLLEFSRGGERSRDTADLADLVQSVLDVVEHLENSRGKQVVFECTQPVSAWVNGQEIKSVVLNLVVNALDSMEEGGTVRIRLGLHEGMAQLEFTDTGCGMSPEVLENIFEPFYTRSRTGKGTGLGLSISHRIISSHGGEIEAVSPGLSQGSTFTVRLPLQAPAESLKEESLGHVAA